MTDVFTTDNYLDSLFGDHEGVVYAPTKGNRFEQHFFEWPAERALLENHLGTYDQHEVYLSPVLFSERRISPETFRGTSFLWTEFDGTLPSEIQPPPTFTVQSSNPGHEHHYWRLREFVTDKAVLEEYNRRIAYHYGADLSVWDYQNVLRPINTWNHKRGKPVVLLTSNPGASYSLTDFASIPIPPVYSSGNVNLGKLPSRDLILAKYRWSEDTFDLMTKVIKKGEGDRSDALFRLAYEALEAGCSNEEIYVLIEDRDKVWGKFVGRTDRQKQLEAIIAKVRRKKATTAEITHEAPVVYRFHDFMQTNIKLEWAIEGLLPVAGSMVLFGRPGIGKSTFSLRQATALALGKEQFLIWTIVRPQRTLFLSLEMQHYELKQFFEDMQFATEEQLILQENFFVWPIGSAYPLDTPDQQRELLKYLDLHKIELIVIDSLSLSMYGSVKDDDDVKRLNAFLNEDVRRDRHCGYIFIHHPRKNTLADPRKEADQDDSFGSQYIVANAQTVVVLSQREGSPKVHVKVLKTRMSLGLQEFDMERTPDRGFQVVGINSQGSESPDEATTSIALGKLFGI